MLIDHAEVVFRGGHGGPGLVSFGKMAKSGPDGGNGGRGGSLFIRAVSDMTMLNQFSEKQLFTAGNGKPGEQNKRTGKQGNDLEIKLPVGTSIINRETKEVLIELTKSDEVFLLCNGGKGGKGNYEFRSPRNTTPMKAQPGLAGEEKSVFLELKLIAHFGLIGLPNAGKSSLLNELTNANAKTANYAFTTLSPNLGVFGGKIIADIPGLIEGASNGRGLGISFLKHIEKVKVLLHCISAESENILNDYQVVRNELEKYSKKLIKKREIVLITKSDLIDKSTKEKIRKEFEKHLNHIPIFLSIHDWESIETLKKLIS